MRASSLYAFWWLWYFVNTRRLVRSWFFRFFFFIISSSISYARTLLLYYIFVYCPCWRVAGRELHPFDLSAVGGLLGALYPFSLSSRRESRVAVIIIIWHLPRIQTCRVSARVMKPWTRSNLADTVNSRQPCHASVIWKRQLASSLFYILSSFVPSFLPSD